MDIEIESEQFAYIIGLFISNHLPRPTTDQSITSP
jgi:hypothetical protein